MNNLSLFKICFYLVLITSVLSCADEPVELDLEARLIGEWLLDDPESNCEHTLVFDADNSGVEIVGCFYSDNTYVSSAESFSWNSDENTLTFDFSGDELKTSFSFDEEGNLFLPGITDSPEQYFIKIN